MFDSAGLEMLDRSECLRLLASVPLGRAVVTEHGLPAVRPVRFALVDDGVIFRAPTGGALAANAADGVVAFEADQVDPRHGGGWSVVVLGRAREISDPAGVYGAGGLELRPWAPKQPSLLIRVPLEHVTGRRIPARLSGAAATPGLAPA
jgi:hypothetical protein